MTDEKGYIQFQCDWQPGPAPEAAEVAELLAWRDRLFARGLIGVYPNGIGYGNLSQRGSGRIASRITGTATGGLPTLTPSHITSVTAYDIAGNRVRCEGPLQASSETLSHMAVYEVAPEANVVIHVHHLRLWEELCHRIPTTHVAAEAGTPAMAEAIAALFQGENPPRGLFAMGGHREGLMGYGRSFTEAGEKTMQVLEEFERSSGSQA